MCKRSAADAEICDSFKGIFPIITSSGVEQMLSSVQVPLWAQILLDEPVSERQRGTRNAVEPRLVLLAHGSRDPRWREPFEKIFLRSRRDSDRVRLAYMEFVSPTLFEIAEEFQREGVKHWRVFPLFMAAGAHLATDVPEQVAQIRAMYPEMQIEVLAPVGEDPRMASLLSRMIQEQLQKI